MVLLSFSPIVLVIGLVIAGICQYLGFSNLKRKRIVDDTPTSTAKGVFIGLVELIGKTFAIKPLTSYLSETESVHYSWSIYERWSRTVRETYKDVQGKTKTRTRRESGWTRVAGSSDITLFDVCDETGCVQVDPEGARIHGDEVLKTTCDHTNPLYFGKGPETEVRNSDHVRRFHETCVPLGAEIYVIGQARERMDKVAPEIAWSSDSPIFLISTKGEEKVSLLHGLRYWGAMSVGLASIVIAVWISGVVSPVGKASVGSYIGFTALHLVAWFSGWFWVVYNSMKSLRERVRQGMSLIDIQLKRKHDLVPRLVNVVRGITDHEKAVQEEMTEIRKELEEQPEGTARVLGSLIERYPVLKSNEAYSVLEKELSSTEQRISHARDYHNEIATFYNARLERFPDSIVAGVASLESFPLITGDPEEGESAE